MAEFVHLHNHTEFSVLDGATRVSDLIHQAKEYGMPAVALTDHGNMYGSAKFFLEAQKQGIKPIIGMEAYVAPTSRFDKGSSGMRSAYYHLLLLAKNDQGFQNLMKLSSLGFLEGFYYKPRIDKEILKQYAGGLICTSACLKGEIAQTILKGRTDACKNIIEEYQSFFDQGDFYLEIMDHSIPEQAIVNGEIIKLAGEMNVPLIATNDCHYLRREDAYAHDVLLCIQTGSIMTDTRRMRFQTQEFYVKSPEEMEKLFGSVPSALKNTMEIAEKCDVKIEFGRRLLPHFSTPQGISNKEYLESLCRKGLENRYPKLDENIIRRFEYELSMIERMGFVDYFLIVWDFINYAKNENIPVGPGRGSAAGSIVAYSLGITDIDPLRYDLIFERFLNPERVSMPDIDIDFCYERRGEVINYVTRKYGKDNVAQIVTFGTLGAKAVVRDVGRVMGMEYNEVDKIAKLIPAELKITLGKSIEKTPELNELYKNDNQIKTLIDTAFALEGNVRNTGTHAAGVVISGQPLTDYVPLCTSSNGETSTQFDMKLVEKIGLLKMDFLGLKTLTILQHAVNIINRTHERTISLDDLPLDDEKTFELLQKGNSNGIFQLESSGMRELLVKLKPNCFEDIIALVALYRPGPLGSGMVDDFINRKHGRTNISYELPGLEPILKDTYGIILYQEQVQKISSVLGGFSLGEADLLRRAMGKKIVEEMARQRERFIAGALEKNISKKLAEDIFDRMAKFAEYGFNKSHSAAYALISYRTAYLKANYPVEFMAALLSNEITNPEKITLYIEECKRMNISILPPDVNQSFSAFTVVDKTIRFGLSAVKNVGTNAVEAIIHARKEKGHFTSLYDFVEKVDPRQVNRKVTESLVKCGAFDSLGFKRAQMFAAIDQAIERAAETHQDELAGQFSLFDSGEEETEIMGGQIELPAVDEWEKTQMLFYEKELLGFYVTGHPLDSYRNLFHLFPFDSIAKLKKSSTARSVHIAGMIPKLKFTVTKRGNEKMAMGELEDYHDSMEIVLFPKVCAECMEHLAVDALVYIHGKLELNDKNPKIIVEELIPLKDVLSKKTAGLQIQVSSDTVNEKWIDSLKNVISRHPGRCAVYLKLRFPENYALTMQTGNGYSVMPGELLLEELRNIVDPSSLTLRL
ncbi:MAG: DNA polymerase III subunit alpha [Candidatus Auribacterota bacterium]|jgi:DNA polymerase-3 subunit alpha|nr:DNA polymerase III subunit alpha [Candidatus Auribacterota bacterium]